MEKNLSREERVAHSRSVLFRIVIQLILLLAACIAGLTFFIPARSLFFPALFGLVNIFALMLGMRSAIKHYDYDSNTEPTYPKLLVFFWVLQWPIIANWILNHILPIDQLSWLVVPLQITGASLLLGSLYLLFSAARRELLFRQLDEYSGFAPFVFSFTFTSIAILFFASLTFMLLKNNPWSWFTVENQDITVNQLSYFYLWHFIESVPVLKITSTLRLNEPLAYQTAGIGLILLFFKILIITPIITTFVEYSRYRRRLREAASSKRFRKTVPRTYRPRRRASNKT